MKKTSVYLNTILFSSVTPLVRHGQHHILEEYDLPELPPEIDPEKNPIDSQSLDFDSRLGILRSLMKSIGFLIIPALVLLLLSCAFSLAGPRLVFEFVNLVSHPPAVLEEQFWRTEYFLKLVGIALLMGASGFLSGLFLQHYFLRTLKSYQIFTNAINERLFKHSLKLSAQARQKSTIGDIVNHMSSDSDAIAEFSMIFGEMVKSTVLIVGVSVMLFQFLGWSALTAFILLLGLVPLTKNVARKFTHLDELMLKHRDTRVTLMSQILNSIRVVKYFVWEKSVADSVAKIRAQELTARRKLAWAETIATLMYVGVSTFVLFATLLVHSWRGNVLDPATVFACLALFNMLEEPFGNLSRIISQTMALFVATERIGKFLRLEKVEDLPIAGIGTNSYIAANSGTNSISKAIDPTDFELSTAPRLDFEDVGVQFAGATGFALRNLSMQASPGEAIAVVGPVGAGKSTLLNLILGELQPTTGHVRIVTDNHTRPRVAYVPQDAFILSGSLQENILFGENPQQQSQILNAALMASCLAEDLAQFPAGLQTEIGEKGVNLSGGQKQRVSLARAYVRRPSLVLLDDPLSAVDVTTESKLVENLIFGAWSESTRVVVTHRLTCLEKFDRILFLKDGVAVCSGSLKELLAEPSFQEFYAEHSKTLAEESTSDDKIEDLLPDAGLPGLSEASATQSLNAEKAAPIANTGAGLQSGRITEDEDREKGSVKGSVYTSYIASLGGTNKTLRPWILLSLIASTVAVTLVPVVKIAWLGYSSSVQNHLLENPNLQPSLLEKWMAMMIPAHWVSNPITSILIYGVLGMLTLGLVLLNRLFWLERGIAAGRDLHDSMLKSVLAAPLRFFDSTPVGRVLQRFSRDLEAVDLQLQWAFEGTVRCAMHVITSLILILLSVPMMLFIVVPVLAIYVKIQKMYRIPAREAKRLDSISRSPRYAHFKETLQGLPVIRAFEKSEWMLNGFYQRLRHNQKMFQGHYLLNRWFSSRVPLIGGVVSSTTGLGLTVLACRGEISPGQAGVVAVYAMSLWEYLNWGVRIFAEVEARMTAVERIGFYSSLVSEQSVRIGAVSETVQASRLANWPSEGKIEYRSVQARYAAHLPQVLHDLNFVIPGRTRVGIVGRTGSGKSTLFQTLYRTLEIEGGEILIDDVDIASVPLARLRKSLSIIPQDPTLFVGTLRDNLDCYSEYTDTEIWIALKKASLDGYVQQLPDKLNAKVTEGGGNFSQGQRQLLCLARALLCNAKILIMDEATASVDVQTDAIVQNVIRMNCGHMTILIIAHRLGTVADCDQIIEISAGRANTWGSLSEFHDTLAFAVSASPRQLQAQDQVLPS